MQRRRILALCGATVALVLALAATSLAAGTTVSVRVEGKARTLLSPTVVHTHSGSIAQGGTPAGTCPATSAAGALDVATHHHWDGSYGTFGLSVTQILGETHPLSSSYFWSVWVDGRDAQAGICDLKLHRGEQLLFAASSEKAYEYAIVISGPRQATAGHPFELKVFYYSRKGVAKPLAAAHVSGEGLNAITDRHGVVSVDPQRTGKLEYKASEQGYIRSAPVTVRVS